MTLWRKKQRPELEVAEEAKAAAEAQHQEAHAILAYAKRAAAELKVVRERNHVGHSLDSLYARGNPS